MSVCQRCGRELTALDIGAHRKFVNRGSTSFFCKTCLAAWLGVPEALLDQKIEAFQKQGCTLFVQP